MSDRPLEKQAQQQRPPQNGQPERPRQPSGNPPDKTIPQETGKTEIRYTGGNGNGNRDRQDKRPYTPPQPDQKKPDRQDKSAGTNGPTQEHKPAQLPAVVSLPETKKQADTLPATPAASGTTFGDILKRRTEQMKRAAQTVNTTVDAVKRPFGKAQKTITSSGTWLNETYKRLEAKVPEEHKQKAKQLATQAKTQTIDRAVTHVKTNKKTRRTIRVLGTSSMAVLSAYIGLTIGEQRTIQRLTGKTPDGPLRSPIISPQNAEFDTPAPELVRENLRKLITPTGKEFPYLKYVTDAIAQTPLASRTLDGQKDPKRTQDRIAYLILLSQATLSPRDYRSGGIRNDLLENKFGKGVQKGLIQENKQIATLFFCNILNDTLPDAFTDADLVHAIAAVSIVDQTQQNRFADLLTSLDQAIR